MNGTLQYTRRYGLDAVEGVALAVCVCGRASKSVSIVSN